MGQGQFSGALFLLLLMIYTKAVNWQPEEQPELPMFAVYESINLGLFDPPNGTSTSTALTLVRAPVTSSTPPQPVHPTFVLDPLRADRVFVTHSRGVHRLDMRGWVSGIAKVVKGTNQEIADALRVGDKSTNSTEVTWLLRTENRCVSIQDRFYSLATNTLSSAIIAASILNDVYLAYALLALDSTNSLSSFELAAAPAIVPTSRLARKQITAPVPIPARPAAPSQFIPFAPSQQVLAAPPKTYTSLLVTPFPIPTLPAYQPLPKASSGVVTPETLRTLGKHAERLRIDMANINAAQMALRVRTELQMKELQRQVERLGEMLRSVARVREAANGTTQRVERAAARQSEMSRRADIMLRKVVEAEGGEGSGEVQVAWGKELARMKTEVRGVNGGAGLKGRSEQVSISDID